MAKFLYNFTKGRGRVITVEYRCKFITGYLYSGIAGFDIIGLNECFCSRVGLMHGLNRCLFTSCSAPGTSSLT